MLFGLCLDNTANSYVVGCQFLGKVLGRLARFRESLHSVETVPADSSLTEQIGQTSPDGFLTIRGFPIL
jgi:hypothetical protein